jgi:hypothetical protein
MAPTKRYQMLAYLDHDRAKLLKELSVERRLPKTQLLREAVDDLLAKHGKLKAARRKPRGKR